jgi:DNA topoisomerase-1
LRGIPVQTLPSRALYFSKGKIDLLQQLIHKGVIVPDPPVCQGLTIHFRDSHHSLTPRQEEMALAWVKKLGTEYVEDTVFARNFFSDFSKALGVQPLLKPEEVDFQEVIGVVARERMARESMTKEERKAAAALRKVKREELKEIYGHAQADGERIELANYIVEPSSIFMGRGKHPLRGRWKEGVGKSDITLNLSPDAPVPEGEWAEIVWQPESLWVARWPDKLTGKIKYIWLHDSAPIKQAREEQKFSKAIELEEQIEAVRTYIEQGLASENPRRRKIATACYLIDALCLRVGDEKDPDEADTVGATTLRPEHVKLLPDGVAEFRFLGKDSVLWHKKIVLPDNVRRNLEELEREARPSAGAGKVKNAAYSKPQLFPDISSRNVNAFLSEVLPGLTAKVFRTHHASAVVQESLEQSGVVTDDPEYRKWEAVVNANLEAAMLCNHIKKAPANWAQRKENFKQRESTLQLELTALSDLIKKEVAALTELRQQMKARKAAVQKTDQRARVAAAFQRKIDSQTRKIGLLKEREEKKRIALGKLKTQIAIAAKNRTWNLGTSQKSYIDPRTFYNWGVEVEYDVLKKYYSRTLQRKFQWVRAGEEPEERE